MTRLLYVHNIQMPGPEANTVNVAKMCGAFAANGCDVTLAALPGAPAEELSQRVRSHYALREHVAVVPLQRAAQRPALAAVAGVALARQRRPHLLYTRAPHVALAACLAGIPTALEIHTGPSGFSRLGRIALRRAAAHPRLRGLIVISQALALHLRDSMPACCARMIVAHDGADPPVAGRPLPLSGDFKAGFVGRFYRGKGLELIAQIAPMCPWAHFHIAGGDAASAHEATGRAFPANVIFHGSLSHAQAASLIESCDVALAPYQSQVFVADGKTDAAPWMSPLKLFEYMAAGKAILSSDLPVLREVLEHEATALLLPPDDATAWAQALRSLRDAPARRQALGDRARAVFLERHTWRRRASEILQAVGLKGPKQVQPLA